VLISTIVNSRQQLYCTVISNVFQRIFTCCRYLSSKGPADDMYLLWYAMLPQFTSFANTPCSCNVFTNFVIDSAGPDSVQKLGPLWHATSISGGHSFLACSAPRPARHLSLVPLPSFPQLHYLFPKDKYLHYYTTFLPKSFSTNFSYMLIVTFSQAILYDYNHIYLQNAVINGCIISQHGVPSVCGWRRGLQQKVATNMLKKQRGRLTHGGPEARGLGKVLTMPHCKIISCYQMLILKASDLYW